MLICVMRPEARLLVTPAELMDYITKFSIIVCCFLLPSYSAEVKMHGAYISLWCGAYLSTGTTLPFTQQ